MIRWIINFLSFRGITIFIKFHICSSNNKTYLQNQCALQIQIIKKLFFNYRDVNNMMLMIILTDNNVNVTREPLLYTL